ncbi:MAG: UDP-N-acetylmuramoyl-L-alanine--D-glutamate ligase [Deltaproteobacteria bacterium]
MGRIESGHPVLDSFTSTLDCRPLDSETEITVNFRAKGFIGLTSAPSRYGKKGFKMELRDKKTLVVGLGKSGIATAKFLAERGAKVAASDITPLEALSQAARGLQSLGVSLEAGIHSAETFLGADLIVLSPGVPFSLCPVQEAIRAGKEVIGEVELASRFIKTPIVGITGSNGKTTTSTLIARILEGAGMRVFLGGNIGTPLIEIAGRDGQFDVLVVELSSFQLQGTSTLRPRVGALLNIAPNHLDHHETLDEYVSAKLKLFSNQTPSDFAIVNADDETARARLGGIKSRIIPFGKSAAGGVTLDGNLVRFGDEQYDLRGMSLLGAHNVENAMAAIAVARALEAPRDVILREILGFKPLPHRIEFLREIRGVKFYNDSKSTTPAATQKAIESFEGRVILIAGGRDKGVSFGNLKPALRERVKLVILLGEARFRMQSELGGDAETRLAASLAEAVEMAAATGERGEVVLLSPACSSFDMFASYEERGRRFREIVDNIRD